MVRPDSSHVLCDGTKSVLSRHRLPRRYRWSLAGLWFAPILILLAALVLSRGFSPALFDLRLLIPLLALTIPALYVWRQGVDVLVGGLVSREFVPRYYPYASIETWYFDKRPERRVLTVWDAENCKLMEFRAGHLTDLPLLLAALKANVRWRNWPV
jgi:hypothetical protein